jgi:Ca-activated chloride channel family protein
MAILSEVQKHPNARIFAFGIGNSVNRFLLDKMAEEGRGDVEYVGLKDDGSAAARRFHERVRNPLLTEISLDAGNLPVSDVYPKRIPDLFSAKPVVVTGRYTSAARGTIRLTGKLGGRDFSREIAVNLQASEPRHDVLASLWARARIDDLMAQDYAGIQQGTPRPELREAVTQLGLDHRLMTQFTSFVAVEEMRVTEGGQPRTVEVPVEMPEGVSYEGVFGDVSTPLAMPASAIGYSPALLQPRVARSTAQPMIYAPERLSADRREITNAGEELRRRTSTKLHPALVQLIEEMKTKGAASASRAAFVKDGKAELQVWLSDSSPAAIAQLKKVGFEVTLEPKTAKMVIGRIAAGQIEALSQLEIVRYAAPASLK